MTDIFCVSGPVRTVERNAFVRQLKCLLRNRHPGKFAFIGDPLEQVPHILARLAQVREDPIEEHEGLWTAINDYCQSIQAALEAGQIPFIEALGLDVETSIEALLCDADMKATLRKRQNENVQRRFVAKGISPPYYIRLYPHLATVVGGIRMAFGEELQDLDDEVILDFAKNQLAAADDYFEKIGGQKLAIEVRQPGLEMMVNYAAKEIALRAGLLDDSMSAAAN